MKILFYLFAAFSSFFLNAQIGELQQASDPAQKLIGIPTTQYFPKTQYVNPFIGTGGHGHTYPGASTPFGMMQLSPDTRHDGWDGCSGYHYSDSIIYGFSHTHLSGTGVPDYCDLLIMPQVGKPYIDPLYKSEKGFGSTFSHDQESASPGYYQVHLDRGNIDVELAASDRAGYHKYKFNESSGKKFLIIDLDHRDKLLDKEITIIDKQTIEGKRISQAWANEQHFYFHIKLNTPYQKARKLIKDGRNKLLLIFPKSTTEIELKVGISAVDVDGARLNVESEIPGWDFTKVKNISNSLWNQELDKIEFISKNKEVMTTFYTALYHSFLNPNLFNDVDFRYRGRDNQIHQLNDEGRNYTVFSLWDTYRAAHPLFTITQVERTNDFIKTFLRQFKQGGDLPVWELAANETECMIGYHSVSVIADAYTKGIRDFDELEAIRAMLATTTFDEFGKMPYQQNGFIGTGDEPESVSKTLEYAYDDFCIYSMLSEIRKNTPENANEEVEAEFLKRSMNFINVYDPNTKFMRGRRSGIWFGPFDPAEVNFNYTEANSWQYSLYAPHAIGILTDMLGGKDSLETWLDNLFSTQSDLSGRHQVDITGLIGQYAHGNEPSHHMAYLYNYTNHPEKTQYFTDKIMSEMYSNAPDGLSGNEDCGQMSAWYVLSSMGLYQVAPGNPVYDIGRPLADQATIKFENGKQLTIKSVNNTSKNKYVNKVILNGKEINRRYLMHEELINGGELIFEMTNKKANNFNKYAIAPTLQDLPEAFVPAPYYLNSNRVFEESAKIEIESNPLVEVDIYYTTDGSIPNKESKEYTKPIELDVTTTIRSIAYNGEFTSSIISNEFVKKNDNVKIELQSEYANQYASSGDLALVDGVKGGTEFRTGDWQGYWAQNVKLNVTFNESVELKEVGIGALRDMKSWIFYPSQVTLAINYEDGHVENHTISGDVAIEDDMFPQTKEFTIETQYAGKIKSIFINAATYGTCPEWHLGAGNETWTFLDEVILR